MKLTYKSGVRFLLLAGLFCLSALFLYPAWMVIVNSLKEYRYAIEFGIWFKGRILFENYIDLFTIINIPRAFFNAVVIAGSTMVLAMLLSATGAFIIARRQSTVTSVLYSIYLSALIVPGASVPTYLVLRFFGLIDTYHGLIIIFVVLCIPFNTFFYTGFIKGVPRELDEAARIDGCGLLRLFFTIVLPLLKPVTMTLAVFNFMGVWNDLSTYIYFSNPDKWVLPLTVYKFIGEFNVQWNYVFAHVMVCSLPVIIFYGFAQKYIVAGMTAGAVKG